VSSRRFISREEEAAQDAVYRELDPHALEDGESESSAPSGQGIRAAIDAAMSAAVAPAARERHNEEREHD
jgi:hypothetical protein